MRSIHRVRHLLAAALACAALASCSGGDSPTESGRGGGDHTPAVGYDQAFTGTIASATDTAAVRFAAHAGEEFIVSMAVPGASALLVRVYDSTGALVAYASGASAPADGPVTTPPIFAALDGTYRLRVSAPQGSAGGAFELRVRHAGDGPETLPAELTVGAVAEGERIDYVGDLDTFTFTAPDVPVVLYAQKTGTMDGVVAVDLFADGGGQFPLRSVTAAAADQDVEVSSSGRLTLTPGKRFTVRVYSVPSGNLSTRYTGAYRLQLVAADARPEHSPVVLAPGDTLETEAIDRVADVDSFSVAAAPGTELNLFAQAGGAAPHGIVASVESAGASGFPFQVTVRPGDGPLLEHPTETFTVPSTGQVSVRVSDVRDREGLYRGPYRLFLHAIDRRPEGASATLPEAGATVTSAFEVRGDVDEYHFTVTQAGDYAAIVSRPQGAGDAVQAGIRNDETGASLAAAGLGPSTGAASATTPRVSLTTGPYTVYTRTASTASGYVGPYQLRLYRVNRAPEHVPAAISVGDTVRGETIDPAADVDTFALALRTGDTAIIRASFTSGYGVGYQIFGPDGSPLSEASLGRVQSPGTYRIVVEGVPEFLNQTGAYTIAVRRASDLPEHAPAVVTAGDSVWQERRDYQGDVDEFTMKAPAGARMVAEFGVDQDVPLDLDVIDPASGAVIGTAWAGRATFPSFTAALVVPAAGAVRLRVHECATIPRECQSGDLGAFWLKPYVVDPRPEGRPAAIAPGDTVTEALAPEGDVDEYTFTGTAGHVVDVDVLITAQPVITFSGGVRVDLVDTASGTTLGSFATTNQGSELGDAGLRGITLPRTGTYLLRVQNDTYASRYGYKLRVVDHH